MRLIDGGQCPDAPPCVVPLRPVEEGVPRVIGALPALGRTQVRVFPVGVEVLAVAAGVVEHAVQHHPHPQLAGPAAQAPEIPLRPQHGVDLLIVPGVIPMVAVGLEDGAEVEGRDPYGLQIVQLLLHPGQIAAEEVPVADLPLLVGEVLHSLLPLLVDQPVPGHAGGIGDPGAAEAVGKDLIGHPPAEPVRRGEGIVIDRLLPGRDLVLGAEALFPQPHRLPVFPPEAEAVPDELRLLRRAAGPGEHRPVPLLPGEREGRLPVALRKLLKQQQVAGGEALRPGRAEGDGNLRAAGNRAVGGLIPAVPGIKDVCHTGSFLRRCIGRTNPLSRGESNLSQSLFHIAACAK